MFGYKTVSVIGEGQYGQVTLAEKDNNLFAIKRIATDLHPHDAESHILPQLNHPNIVKTVQILHDSNSIVIVLEYASEGDLHQYCIKKYGEELIPEAVVVSWLTQMCLGLFYLHNELNIIHRDIKMRNILFTADGLLKIADFGVARKMEKGEDLSKSRVGTPYYLSPETIDLGKYNNKSDIWSLGCVMYELCARERPFQGSSIGNLMDSIMNNSCRDIPSAYSRWVADLVRSMLQKNPQKRPTIQSILQLEQVRQQFIRLKGKHKEYQQIVYPQVSVRTTKNLQRWCGASVFGEELKTAKKDKSIRIGVNDRKVERVKFADRSLKSILEKTRLKTLFNQ